MPFWQQSGNSNSSHLRTVPSECAASTWSCIKLHSAKTPSLGINPYLFQHTHSGHYTVFLSVRTLRSASCEVCLEASCGWTKSIFRYASCSWNTERLYVFFPQRLVWTESHPLLLHAVLTEGFRMLNPAVHQIMQPDIDTKLQTRRNPAGTLTVYRKSKRHRTSYQIQAAYSNKIFLSREKRDTWELIGCGSQTGVINASVAGAANTLSGC